MSKKYPRKPEGHNNRTHLSVTELANRWGLSTAFVRRVIWSGDLNAIRFGRAIRIPVEEAENFVRALTVNRHR